MEESLTSKIIRTSVKEMGGYGAKGRSVQFFMDEDWFRVEKEPSGYVTLLRTAAEKIWNAGYTMKHHPFEKSKINNYLHAWGGPILEPLQHLIEGTGLEEIVYLSKGHPNLMSVSDYMAGSSDGEREEAIGNVGRSLANLHNLRIIHRNPQAENLSIKSTDQGVYMTFLDFSSPPEDKHDYARDFSQCFVSCVKHSEIDPDIAAIAYCKGYFGDGRDKEDMVEHLGSLLDYNVKRFMFDATLVGFPARLAYQYSVFGMNHYKSQCIQERLHMRILKE